MAGFGGQVKWVVEIFAAVAGGLDNDYVGGNGRLDDGVDAGVPFGGDEVAVTAAALLLNEDDIAAADFGQTVGDGVSDAEDAADWVDGREIEGGVGDNAGDSPTVVFSPYMPRTAVPCS